MDLAERIRAVIALDPGAPAVEFEDPRASIAALRDAGIEIAKVQLSSALRIQSVDETAAQRLRPFDEPVYLQLVVTRGGGGDLERHLDLPEALTGFERRRWSASEHSSLI